MRAAVLFLIALLVSPTVAAQDPWFEEEWGVGRMSTFEVDDLRAIALHLRDEMAKFGKLVSDGDKTWEAYVANLHKCYENVRVALGQKGQRIPGIVVAGSGGGAAGAGGTGGSVTDPNWGKGGSTTQAVEVKKPGATRSTPKPDGPGAGGMSLVLPLTVVLTTAQMTECTLRGVSFGDCAADVALKTAGGLAVGKLVMVLSASGKPLVAAIGLGSGAILGAVAVGSAAITTVYAGIEGLNAAGATLSANQAEALLAKHQALNASKMTPASLNALVKNVGDESIAIELEFRRLETSSAGALSVRRDLDSQVETARTAQGIFNRSIAAIRAASAACADSSANPARLAGQAERGVADPRRLATAAVTAFSEARTLSTPCDRNQAASARDAYAIGTRRLAETSKAASAVRDLARDATAFFPLVKAGRDASTAAAKAIVDTEASLERARQIASQLKLQVETYGAARNATLTRHSRLAASVRAMQDAFGPEPPAAVKGSLDIANALVKPAGPTLSDDEMRRLAEAADTEVNRIDGFLRSMRGTAVTLEPCPGIADEMPAALRTLLAGVVSDVVAEERRATAAATAAADIPKLVDICLNTTSRMPATSWFATWTHDFGTLTITAAADEATSRSALAMESGQGPAIACDAGDTVVTGEITINSLNWSPRAITAQMVGCVTNGTLIGRFSNQSRLTAGEMATGSIRVGRFAITLVPQANAFQGHLWRWDQVNRRDLTGEQIWSGRKR